MIVVPGAALAAHFPVALCDLRQRARHDRRLHWRSVRLGQWRHRCTCGCQRYLPFSISAGIGFVALAGVAVLDDMILVSYVRQAPAAGPDSGTSR